MTIHVNLDEVDTQLLEAMAAAARGEEVVLDAAGARVRLVGAAKESEAEIERRAAKRRAAIGMYSHLVGDREIDVARLKMDDFWDERDRRKFGEFR